MPNRKAIKPLLALLLFPIPVGCGIFGWALDNFFRGELIHRSIMTYDDSRALTQGECVFLGFFWLPFAITTPLWIWLVSHRGSLQRKVNSHEIQPLHSTV
jgi:hypothetical protein